MDLLTDPTAAAEDPGKPALLGIRGWFTEGTPGVVPATDVRAWFLNLMMEELLNAVLAADIVPSPSINTQLTQAIGVLAQALVNVEQARAVAAELVLANNLSTADGSLTNGIATETARAEAVEAGIKTYVGNTGSPNGWGQFPTGFMVQWMNYQAAANSYRVPVLIPEPFPRGFLWAGACVGAYAEGSPNLYAVGADATDDTHVLVSNANDSVVSVNIWCVGY